MVVGIVRFWVCLLAISILTSTPVWAEFHWASFANPKKVGCKALLIAESTFIAPDTCLDSLVNKSILIFKQVKFQIHPRTIVLGQNFATFKVLPEFLYGMSPREIIFRAPIEMDSAKLQNVFTAQTQFKQKREITLYIENAQKRELQNNLQQDLDISIVQNRMTPLSRDRVVAEAQAHLGLIPMDVYDGANYLNWDWMRSMLLFTTSKDRSSKGELRSVDAFIRRPRPIWRTSAGEIKYTDWCGIFAAYILKKSGLNVYWSAGKMRGQIQVTHSYNKNFDLSSIKVGDVLVGKGPSWHHVLVTGIEKNKDGAITGFEVIDGNTPGIRKTIKDVTFPVAYIKPLELD